MRIAAGLCPMGKTGRTASLTAIIIVASTDRAHANAPCTISAMMCFIAYVLSRLQYWSGLVQHDEERLLKRLLNATDKGQAAARKKQAAELKKAEKRKAEVDTLFARMYEDWARGVSRNTTSLCCPGSIKANRLNWTKRLNSFNLLSPLKARNAADAEKWIALMKECVNPTELTAELLNTLIEKIVIHEAAKGEDGSREQEVEIFYRFIGKID